MSARRVRPDGVVPLELWDVVLAGVPLYRLPEREQPEAIAAVVGQLREGRARRLRAGSTLPRLRIDEVVVGGGGPVVQVVRALRSSGLVARVAQDPVWIAEAGGRALLATLERTRHGLVMDVGQTSLKVSHDHGRTRVTRSLEELPLECDARTQDQAALRDLTVRFLGDALGAHAAPMPDGLVLALPCEIDDALVVAGCSYTWPAGDRTLVRDVLRCASLQTVSTLVLNDAELAAVSVDLARTRGRSTLVLTVGRGLGAAYLPAEPTDAEAAHPPGSSPRTQSSSPDS